VPTTNAPIWAKIPSLSLPTLESEVTADACVIGLGGSGLACIRELVAAGRQVVGIDAVGVAGGAGGRNGGFLLGGLARFHHDVVAHIGRDAAKAIYEETLTEIDRMAAETPEAVRRSGTLRIATSDAERDDCARHFAAMVADGLPVELYDGAEGQGLLFPRDAAFDPAMRCRALAEHAMTRGARLFERSPAISLEDGCVATPNGMVRAPKTVVAVDGGLERLLPELASRVRSARLQMLATAAIGRTLFPRPVYARWGLDYWQQLADGPIVLGGCRDVGGDAEWTTSTETTAEVQSALDRLLRDTLGIDAPITHRWAATVAYTQSGMPIAEQVHPGVWAIGAYSGTGNVIGALCGRAVAEVIVRGHSRLLTLFRA
jgi:gamma-glutamylputrescine oxidase